MTSHLRLVTSPVASHAADLVPDSPEVMVGLVVGGRTIADTDPSACDRGQVRFTGTALSAFAECWNALAMGTLQANQRLALAFIRSFWFPGAFGGPTAVSAPLRPEGAFLRVQAGIAPMYRCAAANAGRWRNKVQINVAVPSIERSAPAR